MHGSLCFRVSTSSSYRCSAAFKLAELDEKFQIFRPSHSLVLDLAAAPGGFSQVALQRLTSINNTSLIVPTVFAIDLRPIRNFSREEVLSDEGLLRSSSAQRCDQFRFESKRCNILDHRRIKNFVKERATALRCCPPVPHVVLHDGVSLVDGQTELSVTYAQNNMALGALKLAVDLFSEGMAFDAKQAPADGEGCRDDYVLVTKAMHSVHFNTLLDRARRFFRDVDVFKPNQSKPGSRETYVVARSFQGKRQHSSGGGFSLAPLADDVRNGRQVMWHCFGCGRMRLGAVPCLLCKTTDRVEDKKKGAALHHF